MTQANELRLHRVADALFVAAVKHGGMPNAPADAKALAADCYRAAALLLREGRRVDTAHGAERVELARAAL